MFNLFVDSKLYHLHPSVFTFGRTCLTWRFKTLSASKQGSATLTLLTPFTLPLLLWPLPAALHPMSCITATYWQIFPSKNMIICERKDENRVTGSLKKTMSYTSCDTRGMALHSFMFLCFFREPCIPYL